MRSMGAPQPIGLVSELKSPDTEMMARHAETLEDGSFGPFTLDLRRRVLLRDGQTVALRSRSLDILSVLLEARGNLVTKDELMARVWPGAIVEENALQVHVSALRKALGEDAGGKRYIVTIPGRGYRFVADSAGAADPPLPDKPSIAVMPFANRSDDPEGDYFADGVVEDIITALTRFSSLFVIARDSSFAYKGRAINARQIGRELGVRYLLEGSIRKAKSRVVLTALLVDAETGTELWANRFDRQLVEIFDLQEELSASVVTAVTPKMEQAEIERAKRKPTASLQAYDYYLRGLACVHRERMETNNEALEQFYKAIERDPEFASAYAVATWCYSRRQRNGWMLDPGRERIEAMRLAARAAELGANNALALSVAANAYALIGREVEVAAQLIDRALKLNPNLALAWYCSGWIRVYLGESELAIEHTLRAMRLSPFDPLYHGMEGALALAHFLAGRYDEAVSWAEKAFRHESNYHGTVRILAAAYAKAGKLDQARATIAYLRERNPALSLAELKTLLPVRQAEHRARYFEALTIAGIPD
jgi:TolB-like protein/tetratricopeptide (TPR) repeat protein